jgi:hypothetical protein
MSNPWLKKNPFMSMWLSGVNKAAGSARGQATRAARMQVAATQAEATRQFVDFWTGNLNKQVAGKKRRR